MRQDYTADPKTAEEVSAFVKEYEKGFNKIGPFALAALCPEDAVKVSPEGPICGRQAIEKKYEDFFQQSHPTNSGDWSLTLHGENGPTSIKGYRLDILVREGNA